MIRFKLYRKIAVTLAFILFLETIFPTYLMALTSGPSQPEVQSFEPVGTSEMVDLFSGDFNYNIPLLEVGGYPINISYHAGIGMEQEASWVGLGWNLNPGAINRNMRGIPDDFAGETVKKKVDIKDNYSASLLTGASVELAGYELNKGIKGVGGVSMSTGIKYDNYRGVSIVGGATLGLDISVLGAGNLNMTMGADLENGLSAGANAKVSFNRIVANKTQSTLFSGGLNIGAQYNSRAGLSEISFSRTFNMALTDNLIDEETGEETQVIKASRQNYASGTMFSFNTPTYTTHADHNTKNESYSFDVKPGISLPFIGFSGSLLGSYNRMKILGERNMQAYGYLNSHLANHRTDLMDFNREKDGPFVWDSGHLPLTNMTYDSYSVVGQGVGGVFRPYRNQIGYVSDPITRSSDDGAALGVQIGVPGATIPWKTGGNITHNDMKSYSGLWNDDNNAITKFGFDKGPSSMTDKILYEKAYFKKLGELSTDNNRYTELQGDMPLRPVISGSTAVQNNFSASLESSNTYDISAIKSERTSRNQPLSALNIEEANRVAVTKKVEDYLPGVNIDNGRLQKETKSISSRTHELNIENEKQLYELTTTKADGMRYVYGLPVYNIWQESASFNIDLYSQNSENDLLEDGSVSYVDNDVNSNSKGIDNFSSVESIPAYSYSYLLTSVLSSDYIDYTGDGPSDDDFGTWVKFNYSQLKSGNNNYFWKFPLIHEDITTESSYSANLNEGFKSYSKDDKGSYIKGEKEIWNLHSIESKNHIAIFHTSLRLDNKGIDNSVGTRRLDKIEYYAKHDLLENNEEAIPLKTVHFKYDYTLCEGIPNYVGPGSESGTGKLTLKSLYFTYGDSQKGQYSKYHFEYGDGQNMYANPSYNRKSQDRWGCYKAEATGVSYEPTLIGDDSPLSNSDFPYAEQDEDLANHYAAAWNLSQITLPSGGKIKVEYEADDYAYVQNKRAGQMFKLVGLANDPGEMGSDRLGLDSYNNRYLVVDIDDEIGSDEEFKNLYLQDILGKKNHLYYRCLVDLKGGNYEFVPGYATVLDAGIFTDSNDNVYGYIEINGVDHDSTDKPGDINPMAIAACNFARLHLPHLVWPERDLESGTISKVITSLIGLFEKEPSRIINGLNKSLLIEGYAKKIKLEKSFIRLNNPNYAKKGGGHRVKKIEMVDNWSAMGGGTDMSYGHQYFYKKVETNANGESKVVSSGVASYEPILGNDENPHRLPIVANEARLLAPDNNHYIEAPLGESFYPTANVGYSDVIVTATRPSSEITRTATGFTKSSFYTAKDFPVKTLVSKTLPNRNTTSPLQTFLKFKEIEEAAASTGYSIILNDMHGKPKETWTYGGIFEDNNLENSLSIKNRISGQKFIYQTDENGNLDNSVDTYLPGDEGIVERIIGVESEMVLDYRENRTEVDRLNLEGNLDTWLIPIVFPVTIPLPSVWPDYAYRKTQFRGAVATKLINKHGLLDRVEVHQNGSIISTKNELYDAETGDVLLTSVNNEFKNSESDTDQHLIYNMTYPAHWAYDGMGQASHNWGAEMHLQIDDLGFAEIGTEIEGEIQNNVDEQDIFREGDELLISGLTTLSDNPYTFEGFKVWVSDITSQGIKLIFSDGNILSTSSVGPYEIPNTGHVKAKIIRSGRRNQQSLPIASIISLDRPTGYLNNSNQESLDRVLDISCQEFSEDWKTYCRDGSYLEEVPCEYEMKIFHPDTDEENYIKAWLNENSTIINYSYAKKVFRNCDNTIYHIENEEIRSGEVKWAVSISFDEVEFEAQDQKLYLEYVTLYNSFDNSEMTVPLAPHGINSDYEAILTCSNNNCVDILNQDLFLDPEINGSNMNNLKIAIKNAINNFLIENNFNPLAFDIDTYSYGYTNSDIVNFQIRSTCKNNPTGNWIGIKKQNSNIKFYNPLLPDPDYDFTNFWQFYNLQFPYVDYAPESNEEICENLRLNPYFESPNGWIVLSSDCDYNMLLLNELFGEVQQSTSLINNPILCYNNISFPCTPEEYVTTNPYRLGTKGNWRPSKSWIHNIVPRVQADVEYTANDPSTIQNTGVRENGYYSEFHHFWNKPSSGEKFWTRDDTHYTLAEEVTQYNPYGEAIESRDALGIYSSAILGYDNKLAIAVGNNTEYRNFCFDGFEEYNFYHNGDQCYNFLHIDFLNGDTDAISNEEAHTGFSSLFLDGANDDMKEYIVYPDCPSQSESQTQCDICTDRFRPYYDSEKSKYIIDLWVKGEGAYVEVGQLPSSINPSTFFPKGPVIEGWQRIYEEFEIQSDVQEIAFRLRTNSGPAYFDDFRIYPYDANMKSFVYDPTSLKLMAELDENNHATFYEYDEEWNLIRVKKETEKGIYTLQENRSNIRKVEN